jgi:hypothetical protein
MKKDNDLYLVASYVAKPRNPNLTKQAGYMKDPANIIYDERVEFCIGLKPRDQVSSKIILNLTQTSVVRNSFNPQASFDEVVKYFCEAYPEYMEQVGFTLEKAEDDTTDGTAVPAAEETSS